MLSTQQYSSCHRFGITLYYSNSWKHIVYVSEVFGAGLRITQVRFQVYEVVSAISCGVTHFFFSGVVIFLGSLMFACWHETRTVTTAQILSTAKENLHGVRCEFVDPEYNGLLVHAACNLSNFKSFKGLPGLVRYSDADLTGFRLEQNVEVFHQFRILPNSMNLLCL